MVLRAHPHPCAPASTIYLLRMGLRVLCVLGVGLLVTTWALDCSDPTAPFCDGSGRHRTVVVLGGGLAGLAATVEAHRAGASVILVEKEPRLGGNSAKATSGINGAVTRFQEQGGVADSTDAFTKNTLVCVLLLPPP
eukprot:comp23421_c1_seq2/m.38956 comp23421_c1_seq2/g.38956  ORF comp23421_c1_seq2/g.38956 comp23421_c1_seq2/m.38956 type:complete len:137 (-) comp23421_c1_seq2:43-453(-)